MSDSKPTDPLDLPDQPPTYSPPPAASPGAPYAPPPGQYLPPGQNVPPAGSYAPPAGPFQPQGGFQQPGAYPQPGAYQQPPAYQTPTYGTTQPTPPGTFEPGAPGSPNYGVAPGGSPYPPVPGAGIGSPATAGQRFVGALIDGVILTVVFAILGIVLNNATAQNLLQIVILVGYWSYFNGQGQTPGKMVMKTKVVDGASGEPIGLQRAAIRGVLQVVFGFLAGLPYLSIFMNPELRGWHDQAANDKVIRIG